MAASLMIAGCGSDASSLAERLERAATFDRSGDLAASIIELKVATQQAPADADVRLRLADAYLKLGDGVSAEKETSRAEERGIEAPRLAVRRAHAKFLQGEYQTIVEPPTMENRSEKLPPTIVEREIGIQAPASTTGRDRAELAALRGRAQVRLGNYESAEGWLEEALSIEPQLPWALVGMSELAHATGDDAAARKWLTAALGDEPSAAEAWKVLGDLEFSAGDAGAAAAAYGQAVELKPYAPDLSLHLADAYIQSGRLDDAEATLGALSRKGHKGRASNHLLSLIALARGKSAEARSLADQNLSQSPDFAPSLLVSGVANTLLGQDEQAVHYLGRVATSGHAMPPLAARALALSNLRLGQPEAAVAALRAGGLSEEQDGRLHLAAAVAARDFDRAKALLTAAIDRDPGDASALVGLAAFQLARGEREAARRTLATLPADSLRGNIDEKLRLAFLQLRSGNGEQALELAREIQLEASNRATGFSVAGLALLQLGRRAQAAEAFREALVREPGERPAAVSLAQLYRTDGRDEDARSILRAAHSANPKDLVLLNQLAQLELLADNFAEAERLLRKAATGPEATAAARVILARLLLRIGRPEEALSFAEQAGTQAPDEPDVLDIIARSSQASGQHPRAVMAFERLVSVRPDNPDHHFNLARSLVEVRRLSAAQAHLRRVLELDADRNDARVALVRLLLMANMPAAAREELTVLRREMPEDATVAQLEAVHAMTRGSLAEAREHYRRAFDLDPSAARAAELARVQWSTGERAAAHKTLERALDLRDSRLARLELARLYYREERYAEAKEQYRQLASESTADAGLLNDYAWVAHKAGDLDTALAEAERAHSLAPDSPEIMDTLAAVLLDRGNVTRAIRLLRKVIDARPDDLGVRLQLATAFMRAGENAEATSLLRELVTRPDFDRRDEAQKLLESIAN